MSYSEFFVVLADQKTGGPALAFRCVTIYKAHPENDAPNRECNKVVRTLAGMKMHLQRVHGIRFQGELFDEKT